MGAVRLWGWDMSELGRRVVEWLVSRVGGAGAGGIWIVRTLESSCGRRFRHCYYPRYL